MLLWSDAPDLLVYTNKVIALAPIAYYPFAELSGTTVTDESGNGRNGAYTNVTLGAPGIGDGRTAATYNGTSSVGNVYSAGLAGAFSGAEGTVALWCKVSGAGVWTDATVRRLLVFAADGNNIARIYRSTTNGQIVFQCFFAATNTVVNLTTASPTGWFHVALVWSKSNNRMQAYFNGAQTGGDQTPIGTYAGTLTSTSAVLGSNASTAANVWSGDQAHAAIWASALSAAQIAALATI